MAAAALHGLDFRAGRLLGTAQLGSAGAPPAAPDPGKVLASGPDADTLYAVVPGGGIAVVRADPIQLLNRLSSEKQYRSVATSSDGRLLYVIEEGGTYVVLDAATGQELLRRPNFAAVALLQANAGE